jgi:hypothetical protein
MLELPISNACFPVAIEVREKKECLDNEVVASLIAM